MGLFAAVFALVTIYQATLAAGPGRRKCNRRTIGWWATKQRENLSWNDLNRLSIATTPVLEAETMLELIRFVDTLEDVAGSDGNTTAESMQTRPAASWLRFLDQAGLEGVVRISKHVEITTADYLTDDYLAAPSYADLGFIVAVAAASGAHTFVSGQTSSNLPIRSFSV